MLHAAFVFEVSRAEKCHHTSRHVTSRHVDITTSSSSKLVEQEKV